MDKTYFSMETGDIYCRLDPDTGKYYAFQITEIAGKTTADKSAVHLLLDYWSERRPEAGDMAAMAPLIVDRWWFNNEVWRSWSEVKDFPKDAVLVGNMPPLITEKCSSYMGWPTGYDFVAEEEWITTIPEETCRRFKEGKRDTSEVVVAGITARRSWTVVDDKLLSAMTDYEKELWELPAANDFEANKYYPQLIPFLETRHTATRLTWNDHGQKSLDLSRTHLTQITICDGNMTELLLPGGKVNLKLEGKLAPGLKIISPDGGQKLSLTVDTAAQNNTIPNLGVSNLNALTLNSVDGLDLTTLPTIYPHLKWLRIAGKPGNVAGVNSLGALTEEKFLSIEDIFGFTATEFPQPAAWPVLKELWLESIPEEAGREIKERFKGKIDDLDVRKLRKPEWLAENLDNPLRHWDGSEFVPRAKALKAAQIYRNSRRAATTAAEEFLTDKNSGKLSDALNEIGKEYVLAFNKLDSRTNFIETDEREDLYGAFEVILGKVAEVLSGTGFKVDTSRLYEIMDEHRNW